MLIISRKVGESLIIDNEIEIFILDIKNDKIRIGIEAPKSVKILRKELFETEKSNREAVQIADKLDYKALKTIITK
ncbi:MAG TPA: carbon storage regulator CsrA, partial [Clostridia bacterium]|nr:carbon storage regulator CsrA [Clostridia bacterium]